MRALFPGYFAPTDSELQGLWKDGLVVLDTSVLLSLYRYSEGTRHQFSNVFEKLDSRLWVPHQAAHELLKNRLNVISQQAQAYEESTQAFTSIEERLRDTRQHPFLTEELLGRVSAVFDEVRTYLAGQKAAHEKRLTDDPVLREIEALLAGKVGEPFPDADVQKICEEGKDRYKRKIPPGYKDGDKNNDETSKFGDLVLWKQIIRHSKTTKRPVIFVTDDGKEDWWLRYEGNTFGPRPELVKEFRDVTGQTIYFYKPYRFLEFAQKHLGTRVTAAAIDEARDRAGSGLRGLGDILDVAEAYDELKHIHMAEQALRGELARLSNAASPKLSAAESEEIGRRITTIHEQLQHLDMREVNLRTQVLAFAPEQRATDGLTTAWTRALLQSKLGIKSAPQSLPLP